MVQRVEAWGNVLEFPDGMSDADMADAIRKNEVHLNPNASTLTKAKSSVSNAVGAGLSMLTPNKSIADQAQEKSASLAGTAAPQVSGVPIRRDYYNKVVAETPKGSAVPDTGIVSQVRNTAANDKQAQLGKRTVGNAFTSTEPDEGIGLLGTLKEGAKGTIRSIGATADTIQGNAGDVVSASRDAAGAEKDPALEALLNDINARKKAIGENPSWLDAVKAVGGAAINNPKGAGLLVAEQFPNSAVALGSGFAGMKLGAGVGSLAGPAGAGAGAVLGGLAGLFGANTALETGGKAIEAAGDGTFSPAEQSRVLKEGATKGAVITGVDAATLGLTNFIMGTTARAVERATAKTLMDNGVDVTNKAAVLAASKNPAIVAAVQSSQQLAKAASDTLGKKIARVGGATGLETVGEGSGEYLGEMAATGKADKVEAVIEALSSLGQSAGEIAFTAARNKAKLATIAGKPVEELSDSVLKYTANRGSERAKAAAQDEINRRATQGIDPAVANAPESTPEAVDRIIATGKDKADEIRNPVAPDAIQSNVLDEPVDHVVDANKMIDESQQAATEISAVGNKNDNALVPEQKNQQVNSAQGEIKHAGTGNASDIANPVVPVKDVYGSTYYVRQSDLDNNAKTRLKIYHKNGAPVTGDNSRLHRDNIDTDGTKATEAWKGLPYIAGKNDKPFATKTAASAAIRKLGQNPTDFDLKQANGGLVAVRKAAEQAQNIPEQKQPETVPENKPAPSVPGKVAAQEAVKWFGTREKADGFIAKNKMAATHEVVPVGKSRFEIRPKKAAPAEQITENPKPQNPTTSFKGNLVEYTGKTEILHGGTFYEVRVLEGPEKGKIKVITTPPGGDKTPAKVEQPEAERPQTANWWNNELNHFGRRFVLEAAGVNLSDSVLWRHVSPQNREKLLANRGVVSDEAFAKRRDAEIEASKPEIIRKLEALNIPSTQIAQAEHELKAGDDTLAKDLLRIHTPEPAPAPDDTPPAASKPGKFANNKVFTADKVAAARARLKAKLGTLNSGIDPEVMIDGMTIAGAYVESGVRDFASYSKALVADFGDKIKPYLLSFYEGIRAYPGIDKEGMSSADDAAKQHQAMLTPEVKEAVKEAIGEGVVKAKKARPKPNGQMVLTQDWGVDHIDGWMESPTGKNEGSDFGLRGGLKDDFLNETKKYLNQVAGLLQQEGYESYKDRKGKPEKAVYVSEGGPAVSGDVGLTMRRGNIGIYVSIGATGLRGVTTQHPQGIAIVARVAGNADKDRYSTRGQNIWLDPDTSATDLANELLSRGAHLIKQEPGDYVKKPETTQESNNASTVQPESVPGRNPESDQAVRPERDSTGEPLDAGLAGKGKEAAGSERVPGSVSESTGSGARSNSSSGEQQSSDTNGNSADVGAKSGAASRVEDFTIEDADGIGKGGLAKKYRDNIAAIKIIKALEAENRIATLEERKQLAKYVGWGALKGVFDKSNKQWSKQHAELKELLTPEELRSAQASILNAHYTSPVVVKSIYQATAIMGFAGGRILEPSMGSGNFFGLMPAALRNASKLHGVELDNLTSRLARALYPNAVIATSTGFQDYQVPNGYFDMAVGNPPFGSEPIVDKERNEYSGFSIHNYFIARMIDKTRDGGIVPVIVSHSFMDAINPKAREWVAARANLIGAVRLPNTAFKENAGTEVVTDILFFQKTATPEKSPAWVNSSDMSIANPKTGETGTASINDYFQKNKQNILGKESAGGTMYRANEYTVESTGNLEDQLAKFVASVPLGIYQSIERPIEKLDSADSTVPDGVKQGSFYVTEKVGIRQRGNDVAGMRTSQPWTAKNDGEDRRMRGMITLRDQLRAQMRLERDPMANEKVIEGNRRILNKTYDDFVKVNGYVNSQTNRRIFMDDTESALVQALEFDYDAGVSKAKAESTGLEEKKPSAVKADILKRRVLFPPSEVINVNNAKDALLASLNAKGRVDIDYMQGVYDKSEQEIVKELGDVIFNDPQSGWQQADEYLSGDVKTKLVEAQAAAESDPAYKRNVDALEKVIPADKLPSEIYASVGAAWIPAETYEKFAREITGSDSVKVGYLGATAQWFAHNEGRGDIGKMESEFGTDKVNSFEIFKLMLNGRPVEVKRTVSDPSTSSGHRLVTDETATEAARQRMDKIRSLWESWVWNDGERAAHLAGIFNDKHNRTVARHFDGSHLTFPGMSPALSLRASQKNAVWRGLQERNELLDHVVGAGKTYAVAATVMEMRRLGIARKPIFAVPNHLTIQWKSDFSRLYPASNVLAATPEDFSKDNRERLFSKIATGDYDAIVVGHSSLKKIGLDPEIEQRMYQEQIDEIADAIEAMKRDRGDRNIVRDMEKIKAGLEAKVKELINKAGERDKVVTFNELGLDALFIDELHEFKNLFFMTQKQRVSGLGNPKGSGKAFDLFMKIRWMQQTMGERVPLITATGTPVSNSLSEMFTMQRYHRFDELKRDGLHLFDSWSRMYGEDEYVYEVAPSGVGYRISQRFSKFRNLPSLMGHYHSFADVVTLQDLKDQAASEGKRFPVPNITGGRQRNIVAPRSELQTNFFGVPQIRKDENGNTVFQIDPSKAKIEQNADGKWVLHADQFTSINDTKEDAELELVEKAMTPVLDLDPHSIVGQFSNLKELTRSTKGKINALSLTGLANKAGLDYRLIDAAAPDFEGSKINMAVDNMVDIYGRWGGDKGTQLVFCDLSIPNSARVQASSKEKRIFVLDEKGMLTHKKGTLHTVEGREGFPFYLVREGKGAAAKVTAYEPVGGGRLSSGYADKKAAQEWVRNFLELESNRDRWFDARGKFEPITPERIAEYRDEHDLEVDEDGSNEISADDLEAIAGSSRFSVYDDIKAKLIARGIPEHQIAFIHDYSTPKQKQELFKRANRGDIRFLFGSTPKLGAGTNVQERLVGLHHIDAPWRPSDLEQREGRIIRQGNKLYERDPDGFEVFIGRYATEQTYDTRRWQLLEHKAAGIEQLRKYSGEAEIEDVTSEASNAADMKAAASGNPLILEETKLRTEVKRLSALQRAHSDGKYAMQNTLNYERRKADTYLPEKIALINSLIATAEKHPLPKDKGAVPLTFVAGKKASNKEQAEEMIGLLSVKVRESVDSQYSSEIEYRGIKFTFERGGFSGSLNLESPFGQIAYYSKDDKVSPSGVLTRLNNHIDSFESRKNEALAKIDQAKKDIASIEARINNGFEFAQELEQAKQKHGEVQRALMKSTQMDAVPPKERAAFQKELDGRKKMLQDLGYAKAVKEADAGGPVFSRPPDNQEKGSNKQATRPGGLSVSEVQRAIELLQLDGAKKINVVATHNDLPESLRASVQSTLKNEQKESAIKGGVRGIYSPKTDEIWIIADHVNSASEAMFVAMHEAVHRGLRKTFGKGELDPILRQIYATNKRVRDAVDAMMKANADMSKEAATEETLADMAYNNQAHSLNGWQKLVRFIKQWLVDHGMNLNFTDEMVEVLVGGAAQAGMKDSGVFGNEQADDYHDAADGDVFSRKPAGSFESPEPSRLDTIIHSLQDKHIDLKRVSEAIKATGKRIADNVNPYLQEELFHERSASRIEDFLDSELDPLIKLMRVNGVKMADFEEYLWARHAEERNNQIAKINPDMPDGGSGMDTKDARDYLAKLDPKKKNVYDALAKRVDAINARSRQVLVDYGLESQKTIDTWDSAYKHYVPLMREDMDHAFGNGTGQGFSVKGNAAKRATGSKRPVVDILANIAQQREKYIIRGEKNRVATALIGLAKENPNPDFWKVDTPPTMSTVEPGKTVYKVLYHGSVVDEFASRPAAQKLIDFEGKPGYTIEEEKKPETVVDRVDPNYKNRDNVIVARIPDSKGNIQERSVVFEKHNPRALRMAMSLKNLDQDQLGAVLNASSVITRYFASINTQYNPIFGIVNLIRDIQGAMLNLTSTPLAGNKKAVLTRTAPALLAIYQSVRGVRKGRVANNAWSQLWEEFQKGGGKTGFRDMYKNAQDRAEALEKGLNPDWWQITRIGKLITAGGLLNAPEKVLADKAVKPLFEWLSDYNDAMENAVRLAAYKTGLEQGLSKQQAASLAKNLTVNFNRKGATGRQIGALYAFFNASVQGTARLAETMKGPAGRKIITGGILLGGMQAMLLAMSGMGDDDPPEFVKSRSLILPIGDGKYLSVPMPLGFNVLPNIGRITAEFIMSGFKDPGKRTIQLMDSVLDAFNPVGNAGLSMQTFLPTLADPFAALAENKDWTGKPIARQDLNSMNPTPGFTRAKDTASVFSKLLSEGINTLSGGTKYQPGALSPTPDQIDYLISQATGGVGREYLKAEQTVTSAFTGEELPPHKVPLIGRFYGDTKGQSSQGNEFYNNIKRLNGHEAEIKGRMKNREDLAGYKRDNPEWTLIGAANGAEKRVQELRKRKRGLVEKDASREQIKAVDEQITKLMVGLNQRVKELSQEVR